MTGIPFSHWQPLPIAEVAQLFSGAPFTWGLAGGYAVEQFLGRSIREHGDIDIVIFRDEQQQAQRWLSGWQLHAADPPGNLRPWAIDEYLPYGIHDIWGHRTGSSAWQMQLMLTETEGEEWYSRRDHAIRGHRSDLIVTYGGLPCVRVEVQLLYKAKRTLPKDMLDFQSCLPLLSPAQKEWLKDGLLRLYPAGHIWLASL